MAPDAIFGWLQGRWSFARAVPGQATMTGMARLSLLDAETALYEEQAEVQLSSGRTLRGERRYIYSATPEGFAVLFNDTGALFHDLRFTEDPGGTLSAEAEHLCGADLYHSTYRIQPDAGFEVRHVVHGPRKDYTIETSYTR